MGSTYEVWLLLSLLSTSILTYIIQVHADSASHDAIMQDLDVRGTKRDYTYDVEVEGETVSDGEVSNAEGHGYKRRRSSNWPLPGEPLTEHAQPSVGQHRSPSSSASRRYGKVFARSSKFQEASMRDRPSEKPPSAFTRIFQTNTNNGNQSAAVDQLMEDYHADAALPPRTAHGTRSAAPSKRLTHHSNPSMASHATAGSKDSGIYRFGRSLASSFNPANIWRGIANNWNAAREEAMKDEQERRMKAMNDMKAKADAAYAEFKTSGQLENLTTRYERRANSTGYQSEASQRDSGVHLEDIRSSIESGKSHEQASDHRKSSFHFRTPSLSNLRKMKSEIQLGSGSSSAYKAVPSVPSDRPDLRKVQSKKDLNKQRKLVKRVSDLEARLELAKRELSQALEDAPPVPALPKTVPLPIFNTPNSPSKHSVPRKRPFVPGELPTLPSERLLNVGQLIQGDQTDVEQKDEPASPVQAPRAAQSEEPYESDPPDQIASPGGAVLEDVPKMPSRPPPAIPKAKAATKKRKSGGTEELRYKPDTDDDDDAEWDEAMEVKTQKKRKPAGSKSRIRKRQDESVTGESVQRKASTGKRLSKANPPVKVPIKDAPSRPTAMATPAHPRRTSYGVRSSSGHRLSKRRSPSSPRRSITPHSGVSRSPSAHVEDAVQMIPDGQDIPHVPNLPRGVKKLSESGLKDDFEWPDDVF